MKFFKLAIPEVIYIEAEKIADERGFFARTFCSQEMTNAGIPFLTIQSNVSYNTHRLTLRGMHFQTGDAAEDKIVQCLGGTIYDVAVDLRTDSNTYGKWVAQQLSAEKYDMLYIPKGFAHGFLTLTDNVVVQYQMSQRYVSERASGIRWNDPFINISWPEQPKIISTKDQQWQLLKP